MFSLQLQFNQFLFISPLLEGCVDGRSLECKFCNKTVVPDMALLGQTEREQSLSWHQYAYTHNHCQLDFNCRENFEKDFSVQ
jgi:hypothetical protein